MKTVYNLKP